MTQNAIVVIDPEKAIQDAHNRRSIVVTLRTTNVLRAGIDFGRVPGTDKDTLFKPGAERLCSAFGFNPQFETLEKVERWDEDHPFFFYRIACHLIHIDSGLEVATGIGSCNSMEVKYRWRWVAEADVPPQYDKATLATRGGRISEFDFAINKGETGGQYGKPAEYWQRFRTAIANGTATEIKKETRKGDLYKAWEIDSTSYRIPNDDIFSLVNTVDKVACKRALVAATLIGANASEFFTQDIEDMPGFGVRADGEVVNATFTEVDDEQHADPEQPSASVRGAGIRKQQSDPIEDYGRGEGEDEMPHGQDPREQVTSEDFALYPVTDVFIQETKEGARQFVLKGDGKNFVFDTLDGLPDDDAFLKVPSKKPYKLTQTLYVDARLDEDGWHVRGVTAEGIPS